MRRPLSHTLLSRRRARHGRRCRAPRGQGRGLRPRHRHEPVRRLRLRAEGARYHGILAHYYKGTRLARAPSRAVRVLLQPDDPYIRVRGATRGRREELQPGPTYVARARGRVLVTTPAAGAWRASRPRVAVQRATPLRLLGPGAQRDPTGRYRGTIELRPDGGGVTAINALDLDCTCGAWWPARCPARGRSRHSRRRRWRRARTRSPRARPTARSTSTRTPARRSTAA